MRLKADNCLGLIIDIQERLFPVMQDSEQLESNTHKLLAGLRLFEVPVVFTQQYTKGLGETLPSLSCESYVEKTAFSCCSEEGFESHLDSSRPQILIAGIESHICVLQSALELLDKGYVPVVVEDCISSRKSNDKEIALRRMEREGVVLTTLESALFEICRSAKNEKFRELSRIIK